MSWKITAPRPSKEQTKGIAVADHAARRHQKNKAARRARRRTNRKGSK